MVINFDELKNDLLYYFGTAMLNASPVAMMTLSEIQEASTVEELVKIAKENNIEITE